MKLLVTVMVLVSTAVMADVSQAPFIRIMVDGAEAFIVPKSTAMTLYLPFESFWTPSEVDINRLERRLPTFLARELKAAPDRVILSEIIKKLHTYRRQYVGVVSDGRKEVLINCLPPKAATGADIFEDWDRSLVEVSDGGSEHWSALYDVKAGEFEQLNVHGKG